MIQWYNTMLVFTTLSYNFHLFWWKMGCEVAWYLLCPASAFSYLFTEQNLILVIYVCQICGTSIVIEVGMFWLEPQVSLCELVGRSRNSLSLLFILGPLQSVLIINTVPFYICPFTAPPPPHVLWTEDNFVFDLWKFCFMDCKTFTTQTFTTPDAHHPRRSPPPV